MRPLLVLPTVWAFIAFATTTPAADCPCTVRVDCSILSHDSVTCSGSPEVSSIAFHAQPPDLPPVPLMDMGFVVLCRFARHRRPQIQFLSIGSRVCSTLLSDLALRLGPCASLSLHVHHVVKRTCTSKLSIMLGTQRKGGKAEAFPPREFSVSGLQRLNVGSLQTLGAFHNLKFNGLSLVEGTVAFRLDSGEMDENVLAALALDETKALAGVKPLYCT